MEQSEGGEISKVDPSKSKQKKSKQKKCLCHMLRNHKKTKVGCLEPSYKDGAQPNRNSKLENSQHESQTSTKLSLCCAMTERRTPTQSLTVSRFSPTTLSRASVKSEVASVNGDCQTDAVVEKEDDVYVASGQAAQERDGRLLQDCLLHYEKNKKF